MKFKELIVKQKKWLFMILNFGFLLVLIEVLGGRNGVLGFVGFTIAIALWRLWMMKRAYFQAISYGATLLEVNDYRKKKNKEDK